MTSMWAPPSEPTPFRGGDGYVLKSEGANLGLVSRPSSPLLLSLIAGAREKRLDVRT